jgi:phage shock protein A
VRVDKGFYTMLSLFLTYYKRSLCSGPALSTSDNANVSGNRRVAPKLRSRDRFTSQNGSALSRRSQTPPPLPKTVSLPLHSKRSPQGATADKPMNGHSHNLSSSFTASSVPSSLIQPSIVHPSTQEPRSINSISLPVPPVIATSPSRSPSRSPSSVFGTSPVIAEIFRQITASQTTLSELSQQLADFHSLPSSARPALEDELEKQRERKRQDDASKNELKSLLKSLEDQKRTAEASRRDAEKRLKSARSDRDAIETRTQRFEREINDLQAQMEAQGAAIVASGVETGALADEVGQQVTEKKSEVRQVEDEISQLSLRAREMEESIAEAEKRLQHANEAAKERKRLSAASASQRATDPLLGGEAHSNSSIGRSHPPLHILTRHAGHDGLNNHKEVRLVSPTTVIPNDVSPSVLVSPLQTSPPSAAINVGQHSFESDRRGIHTTSDFQTPTFAPFADLASPGLLSPTGERLLPSSLYESLGIPSNNSSPSSPITSMGMNISRSFRSEDDTILDRNWINHRSHSNCDISHLNPFPTGSQTMPVSPAASARDVDVFEDTTDHVARERMNSVGSRHSAGSMHAMDPAFAAFSESTPAKAQSPHHTFARRTGWFTTHKERDEKVRAERKGLNPDAKEFSLSKEKERSFSAFLHRSRGHGTTPSNSGSSSTPSSVSVSTPDNSVVESPLQATVSVSKSSLPLAQSAVPTRPTNTFFGLGSSWFGSRAFEPTPLEREQFSFALGSTANSSLDRLDHLSSLPASPQPSSSQPIASTSTAATFSTAMASPSTHHDAVSHAWDVRRFGLGAIGVEAGAGAGTDKKGKPSSFRPFEDEEPIISKPFSVPSGSSE